MLVTIILLCFYRRLVVAVGIATHRKSDDSSAAAKCFGRSEVERVVAGLPVARVSTVGPADHSVETSFRTGGVLDQPHGTIGFQNAVRSLDHVTLARLPLALHVVRFRVVDCVIELVRFRRLWCKYIRVSVLVIVEPRYHEQQGMIGNFRQVRSMV